MIKNLIVATALSLVALTASSASAATGDPLNTALLGREMFSDNFRTGFTYDSDCSGKGRYETQYCGQGNANTSYPRTHGEHQCFSDPGYDGVQPTTADKAGGVDITATAMTPAAAKICPTGTKYLSGMLSTYSSFSMTYGYWEITAQPPAAGNAHWPAFWLLEKNTKNTGIWPPEIDIAEFAANGWNGSIHSVKNPNGVGPILYPNIGCFCDKLHTFGVLIQKDGTVIWYVDRKEVGRLAADPGVVGVPYYLVMDFSVSGSVGGWTGPEDASTVPATLHIASWAAYMLAN